MSHTFSLHIFNPETDYALACGDNIYNPPASILRLRREMAYFPATYADDNDWIATFDTTPPCSGKGIFYQHLAQERGLKVTTISDLATSLSDVEPSQCRIRPWGWNKSLLTQLRKAGVREDFLKPEQDIERLRELSHRRTCIAVQNHLQSLLPGLEIPKATELFSVDEALRYIRQTGDAYFKMPWSSSGRGVVKGSAMPEEKLTQWLSGAIKKQGSVLAEKAFIRKGDFATEWECHDGKARFLGLSVFHTSPDGRYIENIVSPQAELNGIISAMTPDWNPDVINAQKMALEAVITPGYSGPLGIDMLASVDGTLHPCVEINLRQTMGMAALSSFPAQTN